MRNIGRVDGKVVTVTENLESRIGQDYRCKNYKNKGCGILHMCHVLVWDQKSYDNAYLTHIHHVVCFLSQETVIQETI